MLTHPAWAAVPGLRHGFLDAADCGAQPAWERVLAGVGVGLPVCLPRQVHGVEVVDVAAVPAGVRPEADAAITAGGTPLAGILTADCVPVLLRDRRKRYAAAV